MSSQPELPSFSTDDEETLTGATVQNLGLDSPDVDTSDVSTAVRDATPELVAATLTGESKLEPAKIDLFAMFLSEEDRLPDAPAAAPPPYASRGPHGTLMSDEQGQAAKLAAAVAAATISSSATRSSTMSGVAPPSPAERPVRSAMNASPPAAPILAPTAIAPPQPQAQWQQQPVQAAVRQPEQVPPQPPATAQQPPLVAGPMAPVAAPLPPKVVLEPSLTAPAVAQQPTQKRPAAPLLIDVTPLSLSVETVGGYADVIIERNTPVPCERTRSFATASDNQVMVRVNVAQGESVRFGENVRLGQLELSSLRPGARGETKVAVTFELDTDGILGVRAVDKLTGKATSAKIKLGGGMPEVSEVAAMAERMRKRVG